MNPLHPDPLHAWIAVGFLVICLHRYWVMPKTWSLAAFWADNGRKTVQAVVMTVVVGSLAEEIVSLFPDSWDWFAEKARQAMKETPRLAGFTLGMVCSYSDWTKIIESAWHLMVWGIGKIPGIGKVLVKKQNDDGV